MAVRLSRHCRDHLGLAGLLRSWDRRHRDGHRQKPGHLNAYRNSTPYSVLDLAVIPGQNVVLLSMASERDGHLAVIPVVQNAGLVPMASERDVKLVPVPLDQAVDLAASPVVQNVGLVPVWAEQMVAIPADAAPVQSEWDGYLAVSPVQDDWVWHHPVEAVEFRGLVRDGRDQVDRDDRVDWNALGQIDRDGAAPVLAVYNRVATPDDRVAAEQPTVVGNSLCGNHCRHKAVAHSQNTVPRFQNTAINRNTVGNDNGG